MQAFDVALWLVQRHTAWLGVLVGVIAAGGVALSLGRLVRSLMKRGMPQAATQVKEKKPGTRLDNLLTLAAAGVAESVGATGMWSLFTNVLKLPLWARLALFAFLSLATLTSALRARRNLRRAPYRAGVDGVAVWVLAGLSAALSALDSHSLPEVAVRLAAPLVAAWLWERGLASARKQDGDVPVRRIRWRISVERIAVVLRLADSTDRTAGEVDKQRWLGIVARAAVRLDALQQNKAMKWRINRARRRLRRLTVKASQRMGLASNAALRVQLREYLAVLYQVEAQTSRDAVAGLSPWSVTTRPISRPQVEADRADRTPARKALPKTPEPRTKATPDVSDLLVPGRKVRDALAAMGEPLTKRSLTDGLRSLGHTVGAERAVALLHLLNNDDTTNDENRKAA
ncbi:MAG TPA: hypothetical protein VGN37_11505 [Actinocatenispora sp.]